MKISKLAKNYFKASQGSVYGYGTTMFKAVKSCLRQVFGAKAVDEEARRIFGSTTLPDSHLDNIPYGYDNEGNYL